MEYTLDLPKSMIDELSRLDNAKQVVVELLANFLSNTRPNSNEAQANQKESSPFRAGRMSIQRISAKPPDRSY